MHIFQTAAAVMIAFIATVASSPVVISWYERYRRWVYNPFYRFTNREEDSYPGNGEEKLRIIHKLDYVFKNLGLRDFTSRTVIGKPSLYLSKYVDSGIIYPLLVRTFNNLDFEDLVQNPDFVVLCVQHRILTMKGDTFEVSINWTEEISTEKLYLFLWSFIVYFLGVTPSQLVLKKCLNIAMSKKAEEVGVSQENLPTGALLRVIDYLQYLVPELEESDIEAIKYRITRSNLSDFETYQAIQQWFLFQGGDNETN